MELVKYLLDNKAEVNCKDSEGSTPLQGAAFSGSLATVKLLIAYGNYFLVTHTRYL